tara:strand:- start:191 stop:511 length:321 start_codon:yes stop_codon:yes gene_type:complete
MKRLILPLLSALVLPITVNALSPYKQWGVKFDSSGRYIRGERKKLTDSEQEALKALCKIGLDAEPPRKWGNEDINAAIASIKWGANWPDRASATAYKTCNWGGYLD